MDQIIVAGLMLAFVACVILAGVAAIVRMNHLQREDRMVLADSHQRAGIEWEWAERLKFEQAVRDLDHGNSKLPGSVN
jgi:hypothetical protein